MNPTIANRCSPTTFHNRAIPVRCSLIVTIRGFRFAGLDQYIAYVEDLEGQELDESHIASGIGNNEAEAIGYAFLELANNTLPYILNPER